MEVKSKKDPVFRFKHFAVSNALSAMRVGTDGVLLGAWAITDGRQCVWDVGAGTGLISLMLAQRSNAEIYGVEIDAVACNEARHNFEASQWSGRLHAVDGDILRIYNDMPRPDLIVSNPPYFCNGESSPDAGRAVARHEQTLSFDDVIRIAAICLQPGGILCMVSPADRKESIEWSCALHKMYVEEITSVCTVPGKQPKRLLWRIGLQPCTSVMKSINIKDSAGNYAPEYVELTKDFYLNC